MDMMSPVLKDLWSDKNGNYILLARPVFHLADSVSLFIREASFMMMLSSLGANSPATIRMTPPLARRLESGLAVVDILV